MIGHTISHYRVVEKLGEGGMGVVYRAEDTTLKRTAALKFLPSELSHDPVAKARFIKEAQAASALDHPHVCTVYEVGETDEGRLFIAMACYEGESLQERIARGPLPVAEAVDIARQVAEGLAAAHGRGIVHRDIKPANVFLTTDGLVKIVDFGLAKLSDQTRMTKTGTALGTVAYMAPEQRLGDEVDPRADIWSLGVTLFEMISGRLPFRGDREQAMMYSILHEEPASLAALCPDVPRRIEEIIVRAIEKRVDDRYADAATLVAELKDVQQMLATDTARARGRRVLSRRARRRRSLVVAGVTLVLVAAALLVVDWFHPDEAPAVAVLPLTRYAGNEEGEQITRMVARMLTTDLFESSHIRVLGSVGLQQIIKNRRLDQTADFTADELIAIARSANLSHIVTLSFFQGSGTVRTDIEIFDMSDGHAVATASEETDGVDNLVSMIDPLARKTREALLTGRQLSSEHDRPFGDITSHSPEAVALYFQGLEYAEQANYIRANVLFDKALELDPDFVLVRLWKAWHEEGNAADVDVDDFEGLSEYEKLMLDSQRAYLAGDLDLMLDKANRLLELRPGSWDGITNKYNALYFLGRYDNAVRTCEEAIRSGYRTYYEHLFLNSSYFMSGLDMREMSERYVAMLSDDPSDSMMKFWLAVCYLVQHRDAEAEKLLDFVFQVYPDNDTLMRVLSDTYAWRDGPNKEADYQRALSYLERIREQAMVLNNQAGSDTKPSTDYDFMISGMPMSFKIGEIYLLQGRVGEAIAAYERSLALKGDFYNACYRLGLACEQAGQPERAIVNFERYVAVTELNAYDDSALGREDACAATPVCHSISRPVAVADAKQRIDRLRLESR